MEKENTPIMLKGKPLQIGSFDEFNFCMPDKRFFDVAEVLVLELSFACVVIKNVGMRGDDKMYRMVNGEKVPLSEIEFIEANMNDVDLGRAVNPKFTGKAILFDARERERCLFGRIQM